MLILSLLKQNFFLGFSLFVYSYIFRNVIISIFNIGRFFNLFTNVIIYQTILIFSWIDVDAAVHSRVVFLACIWNNIIFCTITFLPTAVYVLLCCFSTLIWFKSFFLIGTIKKTVTFHVFLLHFFNKFLFWFNKMLTQKLQFEIKFAIYCRKLLYSYWLLWSYFLLC